MVQKRSKTLAPKDHATFLEALKLYEAKQYKKALKICEQILKKNPGHGETVSVRGLMRYHMNQKAEALEDLKNGLATDPESYICWHVYGLYTRLEKDYDESVKAFTKALQLDPKNINVTRDLALLQVQTRQFAAATVSRGKLLENSPGYRQHWNALAIAQYLNKEYAAADNTLKKFESAINTPLPKTDLENTEMALFRNVAIYEGGDVARALEHLDSIADKVCDPLSVMEYRAKYLFELGRKTESVREYRALVKRNPENRAYFAKLEEALGIDPANHKLRKVLYARLAEKYPRSDAARAIPLEFLTGEDFKIAVTAYFTSLLKRGVPSTFVILKPFYKDQSKLEIIEQAVLAYYEAAQNDESEAKLWATFFLAQHYCYLRKIDLALEHIEKCFTLSPAEYTIEFYLVKAKILKHAGNIAGAGKTMQEAQQTDSQDRFVNSKTGKYLLRANEIEEAIKTISLFTRNDSSGSGVQDMHDMQALYFLVEQAEAYKRVGKPGLALKRYEGIFKVFREIYTDQFDFHTYCMHKGTARSYIDTLIFTDQLYTNSTYLRAATGAIELYTEVSEGHKRKHIEDKERELALNALPEDERKRILKKEKRDRVKELKKEQEEKLRLAAAAKNSDSPTAESTATRMQVDQDPFGSSILENKDPLGEAFRYWKPLSEHSPNKLSTWDLGYEIYLSQKKFVLAMQAIVPRGKTSGASDAWIAQKTARLKNAVQTSDAENPTPPAIKMIVERSLPKLYPGIEEVSDLGQFVTEKVLGDSSTTTTSIFDWASAIIEIEKPCAPPKLAAAVVVPQVEKVLLEKLLELNGRKVEPSDARKGLEILVSLKSEKVEEFRSKAMKKWPLASIF